MDRIDSQGPSEIAARLRMRTTAPVASARQAGTASADRANVASLAGIGLAGAEAPVDEGRVADIRAAIAQGEYLIEPDKTADAMIAAGFMLRNER